MAQLKKSKFFKKHKEKRVKRARLSLARYQIIVPKAEFFQLSSVQGENYTIKDDKVIFYSAKKLPISETAMIRDRYQAFLYKMTHSQLISNLCLMAIVIILLTSSLFIREIVFEREENYNPVVYDFVLSHLDKKGPFLSLDTNINDLSKQMRETFSYYAFIGLRKSGAKLIIEIEKQDVPNIKPEDISKVGDLISKYDAIVTGIQSKRGVVLVTLHQTVKRGALLISGNLLYQDQQLDPKKYTQASGIVLADVMIYETIVVPKVNIEHNFTGNVVSQFQIAFGKKPLFKYKNAYPNEITKEEPIISLGSIFAFYKIKHYEKMDIITHYNEETALKYAKSQIYRNFENSRVHAMEKIYYMQMIETVEDEINYTLRFLVKYNRNIAEFRPFQ